MRQNKSGAFEIYFDREEGVWPLSVQIRRGNSLTGCHKYRSKKVQRSLCIENGKRRVVRGG